MINTASQVGPHSHDTVCKKSTLTLGKEAIILGFDIIMGKSLISMEAFGNSLHFRTISATKVTGT